MFTAALPALKYFSTWCYQKRVKWGWGGKSEDNVMHIYSILQIFSHAPRQLQVFQSVTFFADPVQSLGRYHSHSFLWAVASTKLRFYNAAELFLQLLAKLNCRNSLSVNIPEEGSNKGS